MPILDWLNREQDVKTSEAVPYRLLESVDDLSYGDPHSQNMVIQGDNLEALKSLLPYYAGQVKCIYIDPPYNTRSAFEHYDDNLEHSKWLAMMFPRLELLRELLAEEGSIWVSIDDNEAHYLKVVMDEVFGRKNFVTSFVWQKVDSPNDNKVPITPDHEYVLCYEKNFEKAGFKKKEDASILESYRVTEEEPRRHRDRLVKKNGANSLREDRPTMFFALEAPDGTRVFPIHDDGREANWAFSPSGINKLRSENRLIWKKRDRAGESVWVPYAREFAPETPERPHPTILLDVKTSRQAKAHQRALFPDKEAFATVKPEQLIKRVLVNAIYTADWILIPTTYGRYSLDGIADLFSSIEEIREGQGGCWILRNAFDSRNRATNDYIEKQLENVRPHVLKMIIRKSEAINQAQISGEPVLTFDSKGHGAEDFQALTKEVLKHG